MLADRYTMCREVCQQHYLLKFMDHLRVTRILLYLTYDMASCDEGDVHSISWKVAHRMLHRM